MTFHPTPVLGAYRIELETRVDQRGFFARSFCRREFAELGLAAEFVQSNVAFTHERGTLRGLHYQAAPHGEAKLVRCTRGAAYVVAVDLRPNSPTRFSHFGLELSADNRQLLFVPEGCAQGYQTLADDTEMFYEMSQYYVPGAARGVRYDDPRFGIEWPLAVARLSAADEKWPVTP